ncbi:PucR family transcriptional regulator [Amycolatopsis saalfeldensis]|uniref:PucR C-terminal helix-turn-helix domain-containing protein n=1 Tax=Amycolatopsis saalfeldensis TaxID=394193 RepID=A0A1H8TAA9_9PSEU|nr:helix-turn-helix domain-containing protein [Amycolatopsis saalfeldensis]SEO87534.1 PucR C-terminal helix-turn-helix domain-containing protein [Amycolatopsis saalfeldensis]
MDDECDWLASLVPSTGIGLDRAASSAAAVADAVARVGEQPVCWAIEQGELAAARIKAEIPPFTGGSTADEVLRRGSEAASLRALLVLAEPSANLAPVSDAALAGIRDFVRRNIPLDRVLRAIRIGHAQLAQAYLRACEELAAPDRLGWEMKRVSDELFRFVDGFSDGMTQEYLAEYDRWVTSAAATRAATVRALLAGETTDVAAASRTLGYHLACTHVAAIVWAAAPAEDPRLHSAAEGLLRGSGATTTLVVPVGAGRVWAWGTVPATARPHGHLDVEEGLRAAVGTPGTGIEGFRRTHREAARTEWLRGVDGADRPRVTGYDEVVLPVLLSADLEAAREFTRRELGDLTGPGEMMQALRTTLLHYLSAERSLVRVAAELHIARGTVAYRVKRAQEILGGGIADRGFRLQAALLLAEEIGEAVLGSTPAPHRPFPGPPAT